MKLFYDCEFLEGKQDKRFLGIKYGETKPTIDLISIGIVTEIKPLKYKDGSGDSKYSSSREYYAVSKDFNLKEAWNRHDLKKVYPDDTDEGSYSIKDYLIRNNVIKPIFEELSVKMAEESNMAKRIGIYSGFESYAFNYKNTEKLIQRYGKSKTQIQFEILQFALDSDGKGFDNWLGFSSDYYSALKEAKEPKIELYGYYSAYDHVLLSWIFGKMSDLPKSFPMFTIDLKQILDEKQKYFIDLSRAKNRRKGFGVVPTFDLKKSENYPKQKDEHNALADARWNYELYKFIQSL